MYFVELESPFSVFPLLHFWKNKILTKKYLFIAYVTASQLICWSRDKICVTFREFLYIIVLKHRNSRIALRGRQQRFTPLDMFTIYYKVEEKSFYPTGVNTHVTSVGMNKIKSPLDNIDLKGDN